MDQSKPYYSKLLLFGEYTIIKGSRALAIPLKLFKGNWNFAEANKKRNILQQDLSNFAVYLQKHPSLNIDTIAFQEALDQGLYFNSNIPTGYGAGSSGAVCAAVYDAFCQSKLQGDLGQLKDLFSLMESYFHGASSGLDPLSCYLNTPLLVAAKTNQSSSSNIQKIDIPNEDPEGKGAIFLIDTGITRETSPFVNIFLKKCENEFYDKRCQSELVTLTDDSIEAFCNSKWEALLDIIHHIGHFQYQHFGEMIPKDFKTIWLDGLNSSLYKLKLCGAGGGGFILGFTPNYEACKKQLENYKLLPVYSY